MTDQDTVTSTAAGTVTDTAAEAATPIAGVAGPEAAAAPALWPTIDELWSHLEAAREHSGTEGLLLRVLKLSEEVGEVAEAVIGTTGSNPRKGITHTWEDVQAELCDVAITALVALRTLTPEAREVFEGHLKGVRERPLGPDNSA